MNERNDPQKNREGARRAIIDPAGRDQETLLRAAHLLKSSGLVLHPTETLYGLAADAFNPQAVARLVALKGRPEGSPFILLLGRASEAHDLANLKGDAKRWFDRLTSRYWPGPLTLVLPARPWLRCPALCGATTVAVRVSSHPVARQLAILLGGPYTSTSANRAGGAAPARVEDVDATIQAGVDLILDAGPVPGGAPSTLLDLTGAAPAVLRQGAIPAADLLRDAGAPWRSQALAS